MHVQCIYLINVDIDTNAGESIGGIHRNASANRYTLAKPLKEPLGEACATVAAIDLDQNEVKLPAVEKMEGWVTFEFLEAGGILFRQHSLEPINSPSIYLPSF